MVIVHLVNSSYIQAVIKIKRNHTSLAQLVIMIIVKVQRLQVLGLLLL